MILWIVLYLIGVFITSFLFGFTYNKVQKNIGCSISELDNRILICTLVWPITWVLALIIILKTVGVYGGKFLP